LGGAFKIADRAGFICHRGTTQVAELLHSVAMRSYFLQNPPDGTRFKLRRRESLASAADASAAVATP